MFSLNEPDYANFLQRLDLKWDKIEYSGKHLSDNPDRVSLDWGNGAFMGNGMIGCMIYKDSPGCLPSTHKRH